ncbi:MCE family protein [Actinomadura barringtoniae]|uniref:MCE family protein n=1 Tax=Actinomadura barringtoniae TaxID=1427535 RepID=A0A939TA28_9ACTN|nr:MCE family protein [Actinomadura barringtoniae]MBO2455708.1 MCE family protein [Actinomadura barringtoniae]
MRALGHGIVGLATLTAVGTALAVGVAAPHHATHHHTAVFGRAGQGLDTHSDVKIRGIVVGGIDKVTLRPDGRVQVALHVDQPIPASSTATIEPVSIFGPKDLVLDTGTSGAFLADDEPIVTTHDPVEPADLAQPAYDLTSAVSPQDLATTLHTFAQGLDGPALHRTLGNTAQLVDAFHDDLPYINGLTQDVPLLADVLGTRSDTITSAVRDFNKLNPALNGRPDNVSRLLDETGRLADTTATALHDHGDDVAHIIDRGGQAVAALSARSYDIPTLIDGLAKLFSGLNDIIRAPGPNGSLLAQTNAPFSINPCDLFIDIPLCTGS